MSYYSLTAIVKDGPLTAPRWLHHVIKLCVQHLAPLVLLLVCGVRPTPAGVIAGPAIYGAILAKEQLRPSDPTRYTFRQHLTDWLTDGATSCVALAAGFLLDGARVGGLATLGACVLSWVVCHRGSRP